MVVAKRTAYPLLSFQKRVKIRVEPKLQRMWAVAVAALLLCLPFSASCDEELTYTVQPGDTLEKLVAEYGTDSVKVEQLRRFNRLGSVRKVPPGTRIRFRLGWLRVKPLEAKAVAVSGAVTVSRSDRAGVETVRKGEGFKPGDVLQTGDDGSIMLLFGDGSRLLLQSNSTITFEVLEAYGDGNLPNIRLYLNRGRIETTVAPNNSPNRRFEIKTPAGSAGARGTRFRVGAGGNEVPRIYTEVTHGTVAVAAGGKELPVVENFGTVAEVGHPPIAPLPLLPGPDLAPLDSLFQRMPMQLSWSALPGATAYRVQIASRSAPEVKRVDQVTPAAWMRLDDLADGDYIVTVRAIDVHGLEGRNSRRPVHVDAHPLPPRLLEPAAGARVHQGRPVFRWKASGDAVAYHFQLASTARFALPLFEQKGITGDTFELSRFLAPKRYYWRVASLDQNGKRGPWGEPLRFDVALPPPPPKNLVITKSADELQLEWAEVEPGGRYRLQLASDAAFSKPFIDRELAQPRVTLPRPQQSCYLRIQSLDVDGFGGEFSRPLQIVPPMGGYVPVLLWIMGLVVLL